MTRDKTINNRGNSAVQVVVLGGGYAGALAALRLAGKTQRTNVQIVLINGSDHFVERIRLHQIAADQPMRALPFDRVLDGTGIEFVHGWATAIDPEQQYITVQMADNGAKRGAENARRVDYDQLIYALGSTVDMHSVPGVAEYAHGLGSETAAQRLQRQASALADGARILVVGGGLTGIEAATELAEAYPHLNVTLATRGALGANLSQKGAAHLHTVFAALGIHVLEHAAITRIEPQRAICDGLPAGDSVPFDLCVWAGAFTVPELAHTSGLTTDERGRILVDAHLRALSHPNVYAIGDAAATSLRMACATAMPMGAYSADQLAARLNDAHSDAHSTDKTLEPFRFGYVLQCISLGRRQALVQFVRPDDTPRERIVTGWLAVRIKEFICRATIWALKLEKRFPGLYAWAQADLSYMTKSNATGAHATRFTLNHQELAYEQQETD